VPLTCAIVKSSVTPASVRKSAVGKPFITVATGMPPM